MMQSFRDFWNETMQIPEARWVVYGSILICAVLIAVYVSFFFRNLAIGKAEDQATDLLTDFREMRDRGHLQESEFSKLKQVIPDTGMATQLKTNQQENTSGTVRKFMTLAEAETKKQELQQGDKPDGKKQANNSD